MRILVVKADCPFHVRSGSSNLVLHQLSMLMASHEIKLLCVCRERDGHALGSIRIETVSGKPRSRLRSFCSYLRGSAVSIDAWANRDLIELVHSSSTSYDVILVYGLNAVQTVPKGMLTRTVAHIEDPAALKLQRWKELPVLSKAEKLKTRLEAAAIKKYEQQVLSSIPRVLLLSRSDIADVKPHIPNLCWGRYGVDPPKHEDLLPLSQRTPASIVFTGNLFHPPNVDGILFFLQSILPAVVKQFPSAKLSIVGSRPDRRIFREAERFPGVVEIVANVPDIGIYMRNAMVSVCPVRLKIGVQTKLLEALSWGTPVVATSAANAGIMAESGRHLWIADQPSSFAGHVVELLKTEGWEKMSTAGREFVLHQFDWKSSAAELEAILQRTVKDA
jgi:polysaccharide biosynthesis protein PslH